MIDLLILIIGMIFGLFLVIKGADFLVSGASSLANSLNVSKLVIGLTVVAFGTSLPELTVSIFSSISGQNEIILGNVIGSNIANILLVLGIAAIIYSITVATSTVRKGIPFLGLTTMVFFVMANDVLIDKTTSVITRTEGIILIAFFIIYLSYVYELAKDSRKFDLELKLERRSKLNSIIMIFGGLIGLIIGGKLVVNNVINLANFFGIGNYTISAIVIAIGTSLPELTVSVVGVVKKETDLIVGNIVGSNIFNILLVIGISSIVKPINITGHLFDFTYLIIITSLLLVFISGSGKRIKKWQGFMFLILYLVYIGVLLTGF